MANEKLIQAIAVTAELTGTEFSPSAAKIFAEDLSQFPEGQVLAALTKCRREVRGRLTLADVITRIDDGRPGPEEAWAMIPRSESESVVWNDEISAAFAVANPLLAEGDHIAARMAFIEAYKKNLAKARDAHLPVRWIPSLGHEKAGRADAIQLAEAKGRLTHDQARTLLPQIPATKPAGEMRPVGEIAKRLGLK